MTQLRMNQSDDDIFGRNIDQLDRETPRYNLSEEENDNNSSVEKSQAKHIEKKMSSTSQKPPSVASVQPYSRPTNQTINPVMSPHLLKKNMVPVKEIARTTPPVSSPYYNQRYPQTHANNSYPNQTMQGFQQNPPPPIPMASIGRTIPADSNMPPQPQMGNPNRPPQPNPHYIPGPVNHSSQQQVMREPAPDQPCFCADCMHPAVPPSQVKLPNERQKIEDEILLRQRELDSCWQEDEVDYPMDFTEIDRKKEILYAEKRDPVTNSDISMLRESKTMANITSAFPTAVPRDHPVSSTSGAGVAVKAKQQAVVSPFTRSMAQKKVNINNVVSQYSYSDEPEAPQDYTSGAWPQSELGSRIPSIERINLSPCLSAVQSGIQTPLEPGTGQKPLPPSEVPPVTSPQNISNLPTAVPSATALQQLPGHEKRPINILDKFKGNDQYKQAMAVQPAQDSVKDYTSGRWLHSEMGSRIPSSEMISLSPLTMSGIPSGIQTPAEPNTGAIPLSALTNGDNDRKDSGNLDDDGHQSEHETLRQVVPEVSSPEYKVNSEGVTLRPKKNKPAPSSDPKLNQLMSRMKLDTEVPRYDYMEEDSVKNFGQPEQSSRFQSFENLNFNSAWSANTSGLVTPCDHSSLRGGIKPLRQASVLSEKENEANEDYGSSIGSISDDENPHEACGDQPASEEPLHNREEKEPSGGVLMDNQDDGAASLNQQQTKQQQKTENNMGNKGLSQNIQNPKTMTGRRKNSWSSQESTTSNRTDISTVVNAPTSMHNTAPASPDPDGSEASDSVASDADVNDSQSYVLKQNMSQNYPQQRWRPHSEQDHRIPEEVNNEHVRKDVHQNNSVQGLIQMAKEQFPKHPNLNHGTGDALNHHHPPPHLRYTYHPAQHKEHFNPHHPPGLIRHPRPYHNSHIPNHDRMNPMQPRYGYPNAHHPSPYIPQHVRQRYGAPHPNMHLGHQNKPRMNIGGQIPPRGMPPYPGPGVAARSSESHHAIHQKPYMQMHHQQPHHYIPMHHPLQRHIIPDYYNDSMANMYDINSQHPQSLPPQHQQTSQLPHQPQQQQHQSQQPQHLQLKSQQENQNGKSGEQPQHRAYSVTSLEPNRASPPHTDALDTQSVVSFASMAASHQNLDTKTDMVSSLLSMLGTHDPDDMARTLLAMSSSPDSCAAMRQSNCVPLLIKLLHNENDENGDINWDARKRAGKALHNIVYSNSGDRRGKREVRVLRLLENIRTHTEHSLQHEDHLQPNNVPPVSEHGPGPAVAAIMKLSFEEEHKNTICELGGLQTICELLAVDYKVKKDCSDPYTIALRKSAGIVLINLTYNDAKNKAVLCSMTNTLKAVIGQLRLTREEDLVQVYAGITRNISWRPDEMTQHALKAINAVRALMGCIQDLQSEICIRAVLSAVWNLSAHNSENKEEICRTPGSLKYLTYALSHHSPNNNLAVIENAGGILRNVSSHIAVNSDYRRILRQEGCLQTLVTHLRSPSTRVVSNACGVLWNLSARCVEDQDVLWELGAVSLLKTLIHSKHKSISASSAAALRNLLAVKPGSSGTDTESQLSFHHRSNSLPMRGQNRRNDKKYRSVDPDSRKDSRIKQVNSSQQQQKHRDGRDPRNMDSQQHYYDAYQDSYQYQQYRNGQVNDLRSPIIEESGSPPTYNEATGSTSKLHSLHKREDSFVSETTPSQYFVPKDSCRLPMSAPTNRRQIKDRDSSSSSSSFSPMDMAKPVSYRSMEKNKDASTSQVVDLPNDFDERDTKPNEPLSDERKESNTDRSQIGIEIKPYDDCKLSTAKDVVMIYKGTPKLPKASLAKKDGKQKLINLTNKMKRHKKSVDSLSSRDSLGEKSDAEKVKKEKPRDDVKESNWIRTKVLKQRLLNKSHSSDLAFDKNLSATTKTSPFDMYRVASDQCLTMTDRYFRDHMPHYQPDMHHGSWSSCDVTQCRDERIYPNNYNAKNFLPSPQLLSRNHPNVAIESDNQLTSQSLSNGIHMRRSGNASGSNFSSRQAMYMAATSTEVVGKMSVNSTANDSAVEGGEKKSFKSKKSLLKNPLKKKNKKKNE